MLSFDRETLTIVAIIVCIAATAYMYKEFTKAKSDIENIKGFCNKIVQAHTPPPPQPSIPLRRDDDAEDEDEDEELVHVNKIAETEEN
jgi:hypothetical protein